MSARSPRAVSAALLVKIERGGYSNLLLTGALADIPEPRDRRFISALVRGTSERLVTLDYILSRYVARGLSTLDAEVRAALRSGLYQCLYMDSVPERAAVNESAGVCRELRKSSAVGFVNAVLRRAARFDMAKIAEIPDEGERASVAWSLCRGLSDMLREQYGARAADIMAAFFARPLDAARVNTLRRGADDMIAQLAREGVDARRGPVEGSLLLSGEGWTGCEALKRGDIRIQSLCAQRAALALTVEPGMRVLDMCAAPGGKALTAAQLMRGEGEIVALDRSEKRLGLLVRQAALEGVSIINARACDAAAYDDPEGFDRVLCDVPCSGYGETASKPELRRRPPQDCEGMYETQRAILDNGARLLKRGGALVYSTCTLDKRENELAADAFLASHGDFEPRAAQGGEKYTKYLPDSSDPEGFFIATFRKV